jgi:hypothetical protein
VDIDNVQIGKIEDLIIDLRTGCIGYAVLSLEPSRRVNGRPGSVVLPWSALILDREENTLHAGR